MRRRKKDVTLSHVFIENKSDKRWNPQLRKHLSERIQEAFTSNADRDLPYLVQQTSAEILKKSSVLLGGITNEAELRYCVGDSILQCMGLQGKIGRVCEGSKESPAP